MGNLVWVQKVDIILQTKCLEVVGCENTLQKCESFYYASETRLFSFLLLIASQNIKLWLLLTGIYISYTFERTKKTKLNK
jgi:hypothetical protein